MKERKQKLKSKASVAAHLILALGGQKHVCGFELSLLYIEFQHRENYKERPCLKNKEINK